jgi:outer membrane protein, heavy metal efflux system
MSPYRVYAIAWLLLWVLAVPESLQAEPKIQGNLLKNLIVEALANNPDLQAAEQRRHMNERRIVPAGALDDPMLTLGLNNYPIDTFDGDQTPMTGRDIVFSQKFPFPGKRDARRDIAQQQALWYQGVYEDAKLQLVRQVKDAYFSLFLQEKLLAITEKNLKILDDFIRLTETRYQVGQGLQQDVLKAQVERSKLLDRRFSFHQQKQTVQASLDFLLGRETLTGFSGLPEPLLTEIKIDPAALVAQVETKRPLFAAYRTLIDRYKAQRHLAELDYRPDFNVFFGYKVREANMVDDGVDFVSGGVSFNLPIRQQKRDEAVAEADSGVRMAYRQFDHLRNKIRFNIRDACAQFERSRQQALLYKSGIIPQATQALQSAISAYTVGKVDILSLLDSQLTLYRHEMNYFSALTDYQRSLARLEAESGQTLDTINAVLPADNH